MEKISDVNVDDLYGPPEAPKKKKSPTLLGPKRFWTPDNYRFLTDLHLGNMNLSNLELADECSKKFGRSITENSIRGSLNRLRTLGVVPPYRPGRMKEKVTRLPLDTTVVEFNNCRNDLSVDCG